ncbi:unnamed protein product [Effrenium voratum]|nr:unnamed protein product [Effrenium voratum]
MTLLAASGAPSAEESFPLTADGSVQLHSGESKGESRRMMKQVALVVMSACLVGTALFLAQPSLHKSSNIRGRVSTQLYEESASQVVDCQIPEGDKSMVMLMSTAVETTSALNAFTSMVKKLPSVTDKSNPFKGLKVLLIIDASMMKNSFWDATNPNFAKDLALNYQKLKSSGNGIHIQPEMVEEWTNGYEGLDGGWAYDNSKPKVGLGGIGLDEDAFERVSILDLCASQEEAKALFQLQSQNIKPSTPIGPISDAHPCISKFRALLDDTDVIFANGGNPDLYGFVLTRFAPQVGQLIKERVQDGSLLYMGRSAGAMAASQDFASTYEPNPLLLETLLHGDSSGLGLAGQCSLRPHYKNLLWNIATRVTTRAKGQVAVLANNGEGLACDHGKCSMVGKNDSPDIFDSSEEHLDRIYAAYKQAYEHRASSEVDWHTPAEPVPPACHLSGSKALVMLASDGLQSEDAKAAFQALVQELPTEAPAAPAAPAAGLQGLKVLVLQDAGFLTSAFWDAANADFANPAGVNHIAAGMQTDVELVRQATDGFVGMDAGLVSCTECPSGLGGVGDMGFGAITHLSVLDLCASDEQKRALFQLQSKSVRLQTPLKLTEDHECMPELKRRLAEAAVVVVNDGNPDLLAFAYNKFAPSFGQMIRDRVRDESLVFLGRGAGAMVGGQNFALTTKPKALLLQDLLQSNTEGMQLAGQCAVLPGWEDEMKLWDMSLTLLDHAMGGQIDTIGLHHGSALVCSKGTCEIRGAVRRRGMSQLDEPSTRPGRIDEALADAFSKTS